jgi:hypothetical protein
MDIIGSNMKIIVNGVLRKYERKRSCSTRRYVHRNCLVGLWRTTKSSGRAASLSLRTELCTSHYEIDSDVSVRRLA